MQETTEAIQQAREGPTIALRQATKAGSRLRLGKEKRDVQEEGAAPAPADDGDGAGLSTADVGARAQNITQLIEQQLTLFAELRTMARQHRDADLT